MSRKLRIAIIGGGIGGLTAAAALRARGFEIDVYERAGAFSEVGAGIQIGPNGVRVLYAMGFKPQLDTFRLFDAQFRLDDIRHCELSAEGIPVLGTSIAKYGIPYLTMHRG